MTSATRGVQMSTEMAQQPAVLAGLADRFSEITGAVQSLVNPDLPGVAFLARGSSDHAALLGRYAVELAAGVPTCMIAPSVSTAYGRHPAKFAGWLVLALSQSGRTPEIVDLAQRFQSAGAVVVAVTNAPDSPLATVANLHIDVAAGAEIAVPATKSVSAQMLAVLAVAAALGRFMDEADVTRVPDAVATVLGDTGELPRIANQLAHRSRLVIVGRGFCYSPALETALKIQETTGTLAHGFSTADFRHGPIAVCGPEVPAVLLAGSSPADEDTRDLVAALAARGTDITLVGTGSDARLSWPALGNAAEAILATVRGQQLGLALCDARGIDPDQPSGLSKVTLTH